MRGAWAAVVAVALASAARAEPPLPAQGVFVGASYAFTFTAPPGLTYCRLPDGWTGSDHGTILFLRPPRSCEGAGYPSMSRGFEPPTAPRIEVEYERWEGAYHRPPCRQVGRIRFLDRLRPLCRSVWRGMVVREVRGFYVADSETEAMLTLVTFPSRLRQDLVVLRALAASAQPCAIPWQDVDGHARIEGSGRPCKKNGDDSYGDFY